MTRLNQIIAVEKGIKQRVFEKLTELHHVLAKPTLLSGLTRTYQPKDENGDVQPSETTKVQVKGSRVLVEVQAIMTELFDVTATKDMANCAAKGDVKIGETVLLGQVPATYLLFLEKQLVDIHTFVEKLPILDPADEWKFDEASDSFVTAPVETLRTRKVPRNHVKAEATAHHPAQVEVYNEDVVVGTWRAVKSSGALPALRVREMLERVETLQKAVKFAREEANNLEVVEQYVGKRVFDYLFKS